MKKIALIGIGKMGLSHLAIANMTPEIKVVAICDVSGLLLSFLSKNTGIKAYKNYKKMIEEEELDGVIICVPNSLHFDIAKYSIEKKINIFVEKPFTLNPLQSSELVELAKQYNVKGQVGYVNRFNPVFRRVKYFLEQKTIGEITNYINKMVGGVILKEQKSGWRNDYSKGGGCLFDYGTHCFDLSTYFFGTDVKVNSSVLKRVFSSKVDDIVYATLLHSNKIIGFNYINWSDSSVRKASNTIEIIGTEGKILANKQELSLFLTNENPNMNLNKGWNQLYITDECTDTEYYLRGEDFSFQMQEFSDLLNGKIEQATSSLETGSIIDRVLGDVYQMSGGLI